MCFCKTPPLSYTSVFKNCKLRRENLNVSSWRRHWETAKLQDHLGFLIPLTHWCAGWLGSMRHCKRYSLVPQPWLSFIDDSSRQQKAPSTTKQAISQLWILKKGRKRISWCWGFLEGDTMAWVFWVLEVTLSSRAFSYFCWSLSDLKTELAPRNTYLYAVAWIGSFQYASHVTVWSCRICNKIGPNLKSNLRFMN